VSFNNKKKEETKKTQVKTTLGFLKNMEDLGPPKKKTPVMSPVK